MRQRFFLPCKSITETRNQDFRYNSNFVDTNPFYLVEQVELSPPQTPHESTVLFEPNMRSQPTTWKSRGHFVRRQETRIKFKNETKHHVQFELLFQVSSLRQVILRKEIRQYNFWKAIDKLSDRIHVSI